MGIAITVEQYLSREGVPYEMTQHAPTLSASQTAQACHISGHRIAKGVLVKDEQGYVLVVLPASHHITFEELDLRLHRPLRMASEREAARLFSDCETGSIPAVGAAYGLEVVLDESLADTPDVYFEAGDHKTLVHVRGPDFDRLMAGAQHAHFSHAS